jgi:Domain of unknown function (DUF4190)
MLPAEPDTPVATSAYARLIGMTFPGGDSGDKPRDEAGQVPSEGTYEAPPIEQMGTGRFEVPPGADYPPPVNPTGGYQVPPGDYPPPPPGYGGYPPPPPGYGPQSYPSWYQVPDQAGVYGAAPTGTNSLAIGSLAASVIGLLCGIGSIIGIVLGFVALNQIKKTGQAGHGLAVAGIAVGFASFVIGLIGAYYLSH